MKLTPSIQRFSSMNVQSKTKMRFMTVLAVDNRSYIQIGLRLVIQHKITLYTIPTPELIYKLKQISLT